MVVAKIDLIREASEKSLEVREELGLRFGDPVNIFDICEALTPRVRVRIADYSMEGCYMKSERPLIEVSALRPAGRRVFNVAHELGHHVFGHGSRIDELQELDRPGAQTEPEEILANGFAGALLMPRLGIRQAFAARGWSLKTLVASQVFVVACHFGVGYTTLLNQLAYGLREIDVKAAESLGKVRLPQIRRALLGDEKSDRLWVADRHYQMSTIDVEVGTMLLLPAGVEAENPCLVKKSDLATGALFEPCRAGIVRVFDRKGWARIVRISRFQYSGWSTNRHLEDLEDDDE